jgi:hypothetical protein
LETLYVFAYGGKSQHSGKACGSQVWKGMKKIAEYAARHRKVRCVILMAAGKNPLIETSEKPFREVMKTQLSRKLQQERNKGFKFPEPQIVLIKNEYCSVKDETAALAQYLREHAIAACDMLFVFSPDQLKSVVRSVHSHFPKAVLPLLYAWLLPGRIRIHLTVQLPVEKKLPVHINQEMALGN